MLKRYISHLTGLRKMPPTVDPAIIEGLGLDPNVTKIAAHGGSGFGSTFKLSSIVDGKEKNYFIKTGAGPESEVMFKGGRRNWLGHHDRRSIERLTKVQESTSR